MSVDTRRRAGRRRRRKRPQLQLPASLPGALMALRWRAPSRPASLCRRRRGRSSTPAGGWWDSCGDRRRRRAASSAAVGGGGTLITLGRCAPPAGPGCNLITNELGVGTGGGGGVVASRPAATRDTNRPGTTFGDRPPESSSARR